MKTYERPVRFEEVDAAGIVFFARFLSYGHEAMESLFSDADGGYVGLITARKIGFPAVHVDVDFKAPLRYGDVITIETDCVRLGNRSAILRYRMFRKHDGVLAAEVKHTVVVSDLTAMQSQQMPADVRRVFEQHLVSNAQSQLRK